MSADCPKCGAEGAVDYEDLRVQTVCVCEECGARFEVEEEGDWTGDHWQDLSGPGKELEAPRER